MLDADLRLMSAAGWLALALLLAVLVEATLGLGRTLGAPVAATALAGMVLCLCLLQSSGFMGSVFALAAAPGLLAAVTVWVLPLAQQRPSGEPTSWALRSTCLVLVLAAVANTYQALLPLPVLAAATPLLLGAERRRLAREARELVRSPFRLIVGLALLGATAATALAPFLGLLQQAGLGQAAEVGSIAAPAGWTLVLCVVALLVTQVGRGRTRGGLLSLSVLGTAAGLAVVLAVLLRSAELGWSLQGYYPRKALWFCLVGLAPAAAATTALLLAPLVSGGVGRSSAAPARPATSCAWWPSPFLSPSPWPCCCRCSSSGRTCWSAPSTRRAPRTRTERLDIATEQSGRFRPAVTVPVGVGIVYHPRLAGQLRHLQDDER